MSQARLIQAKTEAVYDIAEMLTAADALDISDFDIERYAGPTQTRNLARTSESNEETINTSPHGKVSFKAEASGIGTGLADVAPKVGFLIAACGFSATADSTVNSESMTYEVEDDNHNSITLQDYDPGAGLTQILTGARGKLALDMSENDIPRFAFSDFLGTYNAPASGAAPTITDWSAWKPAVPMSKDNTTLFTIDGFPAVLVAFNINWGRMVTRRDLVNQRETIISKKRGQGATATLTIAAPDIATKNFFQKLESHLGSINHLPIVLTHGISTTNRFTIAASKFQLTGITETELADGSRGYQLSGNFMDYPTIKFD